jgi:eukaryotic-like serine/threonine-protein kinase
MATVYLGRATGAGGFERNVAIKVMHPHLADDPDFVAMFLDEARMAANLRHPNVVPTLDVVDDASGLFIVMEYVDGISLQWLLRSVREKGRRVPPPVALRIQLDLLAGLQAAHELHAADGTPMRLVHRDVSPQNVLVGTAGIAKIMDFGIARAETRMITTRGGQIKGKVQYMSPEQLEGRLVDHRSDVYAAGIVLWEMLTGSGLFRADNDAAVIQVALAGAREAPSAAVPELAGPIDEVCMRALALHPGSRFATAREFADALEDAAGHAGVAIATPRAVAALVGELPPARTPRLPRPSNGPPGSGSGARTPAGRTSQGPTLQTGQAISSVGIPMRRARGGTIAVGIAASLAVGALAGVILHRTAPPVDPPESTPEAASDMTGAPGGSELSSLTAGEEEASRASSSATAASAPTPSSASDASARPPLVEVAPAGSSAADAGTPADGTAEPGLPVIGKPVPKAPLPAKPPPPPPGPEPGFNPDEP